MACRVLQIVSPLLKYTVLVIYHTAVVSNLGGSSVQSHE